MLSPPSTCDSNLPWQRAGDDSFQPFFALSNLCPKRDEVGPQTFQSQFIWSVPPAGAAIKGILLLFHGTGGSANAWFQAAPNMLFSSSAGQSYVLGALSSADRSSKQWSGVQRPDHNPDYQNVLSALAHLRQEGAIAVDTPVYLAGMSNGCGFVARLSQMLRVDTGRASAAQFMACCAASWGLSSQFIWPPTYLLAMENDELVPLSEARATFDYLQSTGVRSRMLTITRSRVDRQCFHNLCRLPSVPDELSPALVDALEQDSLLTPDHLLTLDPFFNISRYNDAFQPVGGLVKFGVWIQQLLKVLYSSHQFTSDPDDVLAFFNNSVQPASPPMSPVPLPPPLPPSPLPPLPSSSPSPPPPLLPAGTSLSPSCPPFNPPPPPPPLSPSPSSPEASSKGGEGSLIPIIAGGAGGGAVLLLLIVVFIMCRWRSQSGSQSRGNRRSLAAQTYKNMMREEIVLSTVLAHPSTAPNI